MNSEENESCIWDRLLTTADAILAKNRSWNGNPLASTPAGDFQFTVQYGLLRQQTPAVLQQLISELPHNGVY
jgi:hypothetical protein